MFLSKMLYWEAEIGVSKKWHIQNSKIPAEQKLQLLWFPKTPIGLPNIHFQIKAH